MSTTIDSKVLEMKFDNKDFEKNVNTSMGTLDKLKTKLNMDGAVKGLNNIDSASKKVNMSVLGSSIETVHAKFSALEVVGITALSNITNSAINTGKRLVSALTIDPVKSGFQEYETQINSVQTILANTASKGTTLSQVNAALDELNHYADMTIYNFTEMTRNIGTFTAAGIDLNTSVNAIQGIANLAAVSGSNSQQASTAMYQLSQALATGTIRLMDWNSVVNAGMGGQVFQDALKETSKELNTGAEAAIKAKGSFRESLQMGWLTSDVLTSTLKKFTSSGANEYVAKYTGLSTDAVEATLKSAEAQYGEADAIEKASESLSKKSGKSKNEIKEALEFAKTAEDAATKVKTFSQLIDTSKEALQSGWTQTWEILFGDFGEAKTLFTEISDALGNMINKSSDARNKLLTDGLSSGWGQLLSQGIDDEEGYKDAIKKVASEHNVNIDSMIEKEGSFEKVLKTGAITSDILKEALSNMADKTKGLSDKQLEQIGYTKEQADSLQKLNESVQNGSISMDKFAEKMKLDSGRENIIQGFKNVVNGMASVVKPAREAFSDIFPAYTSKQLYDLTKNFEIFTSKLKLSNTQSQNLKDTFKGLFSVIDMGKQALTAVLKPIANFISGGTTSSILSAVLSITGSIGRLITSINKGAKAGKLFESISGVLNSAMHGISSVISVVTESFSKLVNSISGVEENVGGVTKRIAGVLKNVLVAIKSGIDWIFKNISFGDIFAGLTAVSTFSLVKKLKGTFDEIKEFITGIFKGGAVEEVPIKIKTVLGTLNESLKSFQEGIKTTSLLAIAGAVALLTGSIDKLSKISPDKITYSLGAIGLMIKELNWGFKSLVITLNTFKSKGVIKASVAMIGIAKAVNLLSEAIVKLKGLSLSQIAKGLAGVGGSLFGLVTAINKISGVKTSIKTAASMLILAKSCQMICDKLMVLAKLSWEEIGKGLTAMGGALAELTGATVILGKFGKSKGSIKNAASVLILSKSLDEISENLVKLGALSWSEIEKSLTAMGGALGELSVSLIALSKVAGFSTIFAGGGIYLVSKSLYDISKSLSDFALMSWDEINRGLTAMGYALIEVTGVAGTLGKLAGLSSIFGAGAIFITVQGLRDLADSFLTFSNQSWDSIGKGLVGMGGALAEVGGISGALGKLAGISGLLGGGTLLLASKSLGEIADSFRIFASFSWEETITGLVGMGGALTEVGVITGALGKLAGLSEILGGGTLLLAVQSLGDIADSFKKFAGLTWDEIKRGLVGMGGALVEVGGISGALGYLTNIAGIIGSGSLLLAVQGLGDLADAFKKFGEMSWEEIGHGLVAMGSAMGATGLGSLLNTFSGFGGGAIAKVAKPLGDLADSVKKWSNVKVPETLSKDLGAIAKGVLKFTVAGFGGDGMKTAADGLNKMSSAIAKWATVTIPENLSTNLTSLAKAIGKFGIKELFSGVSINEVAGPLGTLADSVVKWKNVVVPENISSNIEKLITAIKKFGLKEFASGAIISKVAGPIGRLGEAVTKWNNIHVPATMSDDLDDVLATLEDYSNSTMSADKISERAKALGKLATAVGKVSACDTSNVGSFVKAVNKLDDIDVNTDDLASTASALKKSMGSMVKTMTSTLSKSKTSVSSSMKTAFSGVDSGISSSKDKVKIATTSLMSTITKTVTSKKSAVTKSFKTAVSGAAGAVKLYRSSFVTVGGYLGQGLVEGIESKIEAIKAAGNKAGAEAAKATKKGAKVNSPSKITIETGKSICEGIVVGIGKKASDVTKRGEALGRDSSKIIGKALSRASRMFDENLDSQPTIRPVVDLSDVEAKSGMINNALGLDTPVSVLASLGKINSSIGQNGSSNDDVVYAIKGLRRDIGKMSNNTYTINGVTYDDGSNIVDAVKTIVNAAKVERRM